VRYTNHMNPFTSIPYMFWLIPSALFFAWGEFLSKKFALQPTVAIVIFIIIVESVSVLFWLPAILQNNSLSIVGTMWSVSSLALTVLVGLLLFNEQLSVMSVLGIFFAFIAVSCLSLA